jgi:hypothetical protein
LQYSLNGRKGSVTQGLRWLHGLRRARWRGFGHFDTRRLLRLVGLFNFDLRRGGLIGD